MFRPPEQTVRGVGGDRNNHSFRVLGGFLLNDEALECLITRSGSQTMESPTRCESALARTVRGKVARMDVRQRGRMWRNVVKRMQVKWVRLFLFSRATVIRLTNWAETLNLPKNYL
ncbi:UNVERIFIED_CONTAM: hypothetical protein Slati_1469200 [Sesamum latifolium]|uniref:Uncharacterized protein n=1 Tax=Sesamum latifolium TaxID=2727402 RepID=A0AAW2X5E8_9LAMI